MAQPVPAGGSAPRSRGEGVARPRDRRAAEIQRVAVVGAHELDRVGVEQRRGVVDRRGERRHVGAGVGQRLRRGADARGRREGFVALQVHHDACRRPSPRCARIRPGGRCRRRASGEVIAMRTPLPASASAMRSSSAATHDFARAGRAARGARRAAPAARRRSGAAACPAGARRHSARGWRRRNRARVMARLPAARAARSSKAIQKASGNSARTGTRAVLRCGEGAAFHRVLLGHQHRQSAAELEIGGDVEHGGRRRHAARPRCRAARSIAKKRSGMADAGDGMHALRRAKPTAARARRLRAAAHRPARRCIGHSPKPAGRRRCRR